MDLVLSDEVNMVMSAGDPSDVIKAAILQGSQAAADPIRKAYANVADKYQVPWSGGTCAASTVFL